MIDKLIEFLISIIDLFRFWVIVDEDEEAVLLRNGRFQKHLAPGLHWKRFMRIDRERVIKVVPDTYNLSAQGLTTKDGKQITVALIVKFRISDARKALLEVTDMEGVIKDSALGQCCQLVQEHDWEVVRSAAFSRHLTRAARRPASRYGVRIMAVQFSDCTTTFNHTQMQVG